MGVLPYDGDRFNGSVGVLRDITDRKKRETELKRQNERLEEFTGVVSHDLRSPLNTASNYLSLLEAEYDDQRIERIDNAVDRMTTLVDDLLTLARQGKVVDETRHSSLSDIARRAWEAVPSEEASFTIEEDLGQVAVDESRLRQAFENLFRNAVGHGGSDTQIRVGVLADGGGFFVSDDGAGIPPDQRDRVFDHGYTTSDSGTGLGLAIVKRIFEAHRWQV